MRTRVAICGIICLALGVLMIAPAAATPEYSEQTGRSCEYCHRTPGGLLTEEGEAFQAAGYELAPEAPAGGPPAAGDEEGVLQGRSLRVLDLPGWVRALLLWVHLTGMTTWLGAIIFVHIVQTPRVAGRGIPRGYFILAWPSIVLLGSSGLLLTLGDIGGWADLAGSRWGVLLLVKICVYLILTLVASVVTFVLSPRLRRLAQSRDAHPLAEHVHYAQEGRITVGYAGHIYDLTASGSWKEGKHAGRHQAWQDLTAAMALAPHGPDRLENFPVLAGGPAWTPRPVRLFLVLAYGNLVLVLAVLLVAAFWIVG
jgi:predicted heme/steroid binding protein